MLCTLLRHGDVLYWDGNSSLPLGSSAYAPNLWTPLGLTAHDSSNWTGNISGYGLIFWSNPTSDPSWWSAVTGGGWRGRILMSTDIGPGFGFDLSAAYLNSLAALTGLATVDGLFTPTPSIEADPLNAGVVAFTVIGSRQISGGITLSKDQPTGTYPWLAHNKAGNVDFVVSGDTAFLQRTNFTDQQAFFRNLWTVPL